MKGLRVLAAGIAAAIVWWAGLLLVFGPAQSLLADPERQSAKFLAAFTESPLPRVAQRPELLAVGLLLIGVVYAGCYAWLEPKLRGSAIRRGAGFGILAWALLIPWFEFYLPWNVMHEPVLLVLLEVLCWLIVLLGVGLATASVYAVTDRRRARRD